MADVEINLIVNCDDAVVFWRIAARIDGCWGFAIERERKLPDGTVQRIALDNRMGFEKDAPAVGDHRPSVLWPFQRFWWADHSADLGDTVRYRVTPMVRADDKLVQLVTAQSRWTAWTVLSGGTKDGFSSFFNRGLVISQFMARYLEDLRLKEGLATRKQALASFKKTLGDHEMPIRIFLSGALRVRMLEMLATAKKSGQHVFGALYELADDELVDALCALGGNAHIVLANGSITAKKGETSAQARLRDENAEARATLRTGKVEVFDRFVSPGALGHNKFLVVADKKQSARAVWTGSTNWTSTGLCTQINNGLFVQNPQVAADYLAQWTRLRDAGSAFPPELATANSQPKAGAKGKTTTALWFSRTRGKVDLQALDDVVSAAKEGVLFLMFQPGGAGALASVRKLQKANPSLYVKGVVSTLPGGADGGDPGDETQVTVDIQGTTSGDKTSLNLNVVEPEGLKTPFASWAATVTRNEFVTLKGGVIGFAIVHSKIIVVDPFTNPVVVTGSHNFSTTASTSNDENFLIVRGNDELARHYATHILSVYEHYRWMAFVNEQQAKGTPPSGFLKENDLWQDSRLKGAAKREIDFWVR